MTRKINCQPTIPFIDSQIKESLGEGEWVTDVFTLVTLRAKFIALNKLK